MLNSIVPFPNNASLYEDVDWHKEFGFATVPDPQKMTLPPQYSGDLPSLPVDLDAVKFVGDACLNDVQKSLLGANGFVVVPGGFEQFYDAYQGKPEWKTTPDDWQNTGDDDAICHPYFVTTDAVLHILHYLFGELLQELEQEKFAPNFVSKVMQSVHAAARMQRIALSGSDLEEAARAAELYLAVALELMQPGLGLESASSDLGADLQMIVAWAYAGSGQHTLPFFPEYLEDFSQYQPRGHYAGTVVLENYFRGMMWLGRITFCADNTFATQIALLLVRALRGSEQSVEVWCTVDQMLTFLFGPVDDLGPLAYSQLADEIFGPELDLAALCDSTRFADYQEALKILPGPKINGLTLRDDIAADEVADETRGFRFFGQRFILDGYSMQQLLYPFVGTSNQPRLLPLGLDVAATVGGSDRAYDLAQQAGASDYAHYDDQVAFLRKEFDALSNEDWTESFFGSWLWALRPLWKREDAPYPPLMRSEAWGYKDLQTGLASWTELRHDSALYVKQPTIGAGGGPPLKSFGYVEPNPLVFVRIGFAAQKLYVILKSALMTLTGISGKVSTLPTNLLSLSILAMQSTEFAEMARKELAGESLNRSDYYTIMSFEKWLYQLQIPAPSDADDIDPVALVTDVASDPKTGRVLQVGVGGVDHMYVVIPNPFGGFQLARGAVFSHYEWVGSISQRMTDDQWRDLVKQDQLPDRPSWVNALFVE